MKRFKMSIDGDLERSLWSRFAGSPEHCFNKPRLYVIISAEICMGKSVLGCMLASGNHDFLLVQIGNLREIDLKQHFEEYKRIYPKANGMILDVDYERNPDFIALDKDEALARFFDIRYVAMFKNLDSNLEAGQ